MAKANATNVHGNVAVPAVVHFVNCAEDVIPSPVRGFLRRSGKLVPTQRLPPMEDAFSIMDTFESDVYKKVAALASRCDYKDPLSGLRRQFHQERSSWKSDRSSLPSSVHTFVTDVRAVFLVKFQHKKLLGNDRPFKVLTVIIHGYLGAALA